MKERKRCREHVLVIRYKCPISRTTHRHMNGTACMKKLKCELSSQMNLCLVFTQHHCPSLWYSVGMQCGSVAVWIIVDSHISGVGDFFQVAIISSCFREHQFYVWIWEEPVYGDVLEKRLWVGVERREIKDDENKSCKIETVVEISVIWNMFIISSHNL